MVSTHSRLKAAGLNTFDERMSFPVSTHSRLKAAGTGCLSSPHISCVSTHSRLKAAGYDPEVEVSGIYVSTHSRLKAAGSGGRTTEKRGRSFNTQPPKGGWIFRRQQDCHCLWFQHTAA